MHKRLLFALAGTVFGLAAGAHAELAPDYRVVLLTENFPPYNMAINGKNFAQEDNLDGIAVDIVREMFKRAGQPADLHLFAETDHFMFAEENTRVRTVVNGWLERFFPAK